MKEDIMMRKRLHIILSLLLAVCMLAAAGLAFADGTPTLDGVHDQSVMAGTEFNRRHTGSGFQKRKSNP